MPGNRFETLFKVILVIFLGLILRIFYLQVFDGQNLQKAASAQRTANSQIEKPRGEILDRNDIPFTDKNSRIIVAIKPLLLRDKNGDVEKLCDILGLDFSKVKKDIEIKSGPILFETDQRRKDLVMSLNIQGVSSISLLKRYDQNSLARHVLGYLKKIDNIGETGIEKSYEEILKYDRKNTVGVVTDARNNIIQGLGYRISATGNENRKLNVKLTLDYHIQKIVEAAMERQKITGAVVVEDVYTGDIMAMASKPDYDQNSVENYLSSPKNELFNRAVASYNVGSIFKIVDAILMFKSNYYMDKEYFCPGYIRIGDKEFKCSSYDRGGHGWINLKDAFAYSCNPYFINAGVKIGNEDLTSMAGKLGLGRYTGIKEQGIDESPGILPDINGYFSKGDVANIAIGQGDILASPLQIADLVATVANGGIKNKINIVDSIVDSDGGILKTVREKKGERVVSKDVADKVKYLMETVTRYGTGTRASLEKYGGSGGKTGSAETGQYIDGEKVVHAWFAGYFPRNNPKYSVAVFVEDGKNGGQAAAPVFEEIAEEITKKGL